MSYFRRIQKFHREKAEREARATREAREEQQRKEREKERVAEQALQDRDVQVRIDFEILEFRGQDFAALFYSFKI